MKNFFEHQADAQRRTRWLLLGLLVAIAGMGSLLFALLWLLGSIVFGRAMASLATDPGWAEHLFIACLLGTASVVLLASAVRTASLRSGGESIAHMLGGRLVSGAARDALERRLLNVVEEMAIAAGAPVPRVFVLDAEAGINAFAAGWQLHDATIAVTRGCLDKLNRSELQGVIGHEFSHILRGDMRLNLRLTGALFGILFITIVGRHSLRAGNLSRRHGAPLAVLGVGLMGIGGLGLLCAKLIKAAVGRQREYLADASAIQYTRDASSIAGALKKIGGYTTGSLIGSANAEEASHFFFADAQIHRFSAALFATHPPLLERIQRIEPEFRGPVPKLAEPSTSSATAVDAEPMPLTAPPRSVPPPAALVMRLAGAPTTNALRASASWIDKIASPLREATRSAFSASALIHAMVLSETEAVRSAQRQVIANTSGTRTLAEVDRLWVRLKDLPNSDRLSLAELASPALQALVAPQRATFTRTLDRLIEADAAISLFEYVLADLLRAQAKPALARSGRRLGHVVREVELVISLLAHAGDLDGQSAAGAFGRAAVRLPAISITLLPASARQLSGLGPALAALRALRPSDGAQLVDACAHAVLADQRATDAELTLLRAICLALGTPLPLLG